MFKFCNLCKYTVQWMDRFNLSILQYFNLNIEQSSFFNLQNRQVSLIVDQDFHSLGKQIFRSRLRFRGANKYIEKLENFKRKKKIFFPIFEFFF